MVRASAVILYTQWNHAPTQTRNTNQMKRLLLLALLLSGCEVTPQIIAICQKICVPHDGLVGITAGDKFVCRCKNGRRFTSIQAEIITEHVEFWKNKCPEAKEKQ